MTFCGSLETNCLSIIKEASMSRPTLTDTNPVELKHYSFIMSIDNCYMKLKHWWNIFHLTVNANSVVQNSVQIKNGIMVNANVSVKSIVRVKIILGILADVFVRTEDI